MDQNQARQYLLKQPESLLDHLFCDDIQVFNIKGKMFATLAIDNPSGHYWRI